MTTRISYAGLLKVIAKITFTSLNIHGGESQKYEIYFKIRQFGREIFKMLPSRHVKYVCQKNGTEKINSNGIYGTGTKIAIIVNMFAMNIFFSF